MNATGLFALDGKVAVVTGAAGLLGRRHCAALAAAGATVVGADTISAETFRVRTGDLTERFSSSLTYEMMDVTSPESIHALKHRVISGHGCLDVLVNNAAMNDMFEEKDGSRKVTGFEDFPLEAWNRTFSVNVTGTFLCSQILGGIMAEAGSGSIINIASTYGMVGADQSIYVDPGGIRRMIKSPAYGATKGAVLAFTKYLAALWGARGIRVNALSPGGVKNGQEEFFVNNYAARTMLGRMAGPDDYEGAIVFLASDASRYMTGANLVVDGGWTAW